MAQIDVFGLLGVEHVDCLEDEQNVADNPIIQMGGTSIMCSLFSGWPRLHSTQTMILSPGLVRTGRPIMRQKEQ